jgi:hypothetical protein
MKELKDQVKDWKKTHPSKEPPPSKKPLPKTLKSSEKAPPKKTDEELFAEAVAGVDQRAVEKKYDDTPLPPPPREDKKTRVDREQKLFEDFVGPVNKK